MNIKRVIIDLCDGCLNGDGEECHTPGCALFLHSSPGHSIAPELYCVLPDAEGEAIRDVIAERRRQIEEEGYDAEHDDEHNGPDTLALAAVAYLLEASGISGEDFWPWGTEFKPKGKRRNLIRGNALGLAALERMDRTPHTTQED